MNHEDQKGSPEASRPPFHPTELQLCEAIVSMANGIERAAEVHAIVQPFLTIFRRHGEVINYAEDLVKQMKQRRQATEPA